MHRLLGWMVLVFKFLVNLRDEGTVSWATLECLLCKIVCSCHLSKNERPPQSVAILFFVADRPHDDQMVWKTACWVC